MRDWPAGVEEREVRGALAEGWRISAATMRYAPVGAGSYHWVVRDDLDRQWFVNVDDLDDKHWLGDDRPTAFGGLRTAMDTAHTLRHQAGLRFVLAPVPAGDGATVLPLGPRYALTVFPFVHGASADLGDAFSADERGQLVDMLATLHQATPTASRASRFPIEVPQREVLEKALGEVGRPWSGGPFSEPARALITANAEQIRHLMAAFDQLADGVRALEPVITHGEPHPANLIRTGLGAGTGPPAGTGTGMLLIDWDTVGLAPPERDLWMVVSEGGQEGRRYTGATGRPVDLDALALYRIRWALDDISCFLRDLRAEHRRTADIERAWQGLNAELAHAPS